MPRDGLELAVDELLRILREEELKRRLALGRRWLGRFEAVSDGAAVDVHQARCYVGGERMFREAVERRVLDGVLERLRPLIPQHWSADGKVFACEAFMLSRPTP